ncbi:hypothetical protein BJP62_04495 [Jeongeupia sp. USM3]|nr:hypothetical protein BJP62_04495 [Jeongeupia sp. USM3]
MTEAGVCPVDALPAAGQLEWLIHPAHAGVHALTLPRQSPARLRTLLPHALEDELLAPVAGLHLAMQRENDGRVAVRSVDRTWLDSWRQRFTARPPAAAWALADLLPAGDAQLPLGGGVLLRTAGSEAGWLDDAALAGVIAGDKPPEQFDIDELALGPCHVNVLQGEFAPRATPRLDWRQWRRTGLLAGVLLTLLLIGQIARWWELRHDVDALKRGLRQSYAAAFPGEPVVDPALQLASKLRQRGGDTGLLARLQQIDSSDVAAGAIGRIDYRNGELAVELTPAAADAISARLAANGITPKREPAGDGRVRLQW